MPTLSITSDEGKELLRIQIRRLDPDEATIAILKAIKELPEPRKTRKDAGRKRAQPEPEIT